MKKYIKVIVLIVLYLTPCTILFLKNEAFCFLLGIHLSFLILFPSMYFKIIDAKDENKLIKLKTFMRLVYAVGLIMNLAILSSLFELMSDKKILAISFLLIVTMLNNAQVILKNNKGDILSVYLEDEEVYTKTNRLTSKAVVFGSIFGVAFIIQNPFTGWHIVLYSTYFILVQILGFFYARTIYHKKHYAA